MCAKDMQTSFVFLKLCPYCTQVDWDSSVAIYRDVTQASSDQGGLIDTSKNVTARSISAGLITIAIKGNPAIFNRQSAQSFHLEIEQLSVMHFLDATRFETVLGLIRSNSAYSVVTNPATGRPHIEFTQVTRNS